MRTLLVGLLICLVGCDGPMFRRSRNPDKRSVRTAVASTLPAYLTPHDVTVRSEGNGNSRQLIQFELEVSPTVALFDTAGANPPAQEVFQLRRSYKAGERIKLFGAITAHGSETAWGFSDLQWEKEPTILGRPRDAWPGTYVMEGSPEAAEVAAAKGKLREAQAAVERRIRQEKEELDARLETERTSRRAEEARVAKLELENQTIRLELEAKQLRLESVDRDEGAKRLLVAAQRRIEGEEQKGKALDADRQRRLLEFMAAFSPGTRYSGMITNAGTGYRQDFRMRCVSTNDHEATWEIVGQNERTRRFKGKVIWEKEHDFLFLNSLPVEAYPHNPDEKSGWMVLPGTINLKVPAAGTIEGVGTFKGTSFREQLTYNLVIKRE